MGSIFDAMNRASGGEYQHRIAAPTPAPTLAPEPAPPVPAAAAAPPPPTPTPDLPRLAADPAPDREGPDHPTWADAEMAPTPEQEQESILADTGTPGSGAAGHLVWKPGTIDDRLVALSAPASLMSEEYRAIRTSILARRDPNRHLVHMITSATPQEGKTITALNLGLTFAELRNRRTLVVEADLRLPQFAKLLMLPDHPGLIGVLNGTRRLQETIVEIEQANLHLMVAGGRANNGAVQLLHSPRMVELLAALRRRYDHIIIDTPPIVELADAGIIGAMSDDVLMVVRMGRTPESLVRQAIRTLGSYNVQVAGLVATALMRHRGRYYYRYGYRYRYRYQYGDQHPDRKAA